MYKIVITILVLSFSLTSIDAQADRYADSLFSAANAEYKQESYHIAIDLYNEVVDTGYKSFELFYNLGNAYYKSGIYPKAILNYERALLIKPGDENAEFNLQKANAYTIDRIEMIPEFFLVTWFEGFISMFKSNVWAIISILVFVLGLIMFLFYFISRSRQTRVIGFSIGIISVLIALFSFIFSVKTRNYIENTDRGIVMSPTVTIKGAPDENGVNVFIIHEGTKVRIIRSIGEWAEIRLADGKQGWMLESEMEKI